MSVPQQGIFAQGTTAHHFLEFDLRPDLATATIVTALSRLRQPAVSAGAVNLIIAFGPDLWRRIAPEHVPDTLHPFSDIAGRDGRCAPATQHDVWVWINGSLTDVVFGHVRRSALSSRIFHLARRTPYD